MTPFAYCGLLAAAAIAVGIWWLAPRVGPSSGRPVQGLVLLLAVLMCVLAVKGQSRGAIGPRSALAAAAAGQVAGH
jgi:hypothetical protein